MRLTIVTRHFKCIHFSSLLIGTTLAFLLGSFSHLVPCNIVFFV